MHIRDIAFCASLGALVGLCAYLIASPHLPFWSTVFMFAVLAAAAGGILHALRGPS